MFRPPSFGSQPPPSGGIFGTPAGQQPAGGIFGQAVPPSPFAPQNTASAFGMQQQQPANPFAQQQQQASVGGAIGANAGRSGTSNPSYQMTRELESDMQVTFKSICAMPSYAMKSYEELRLEDYACGRKGPSNPFTASNAAPMGMFGGASAYGSAQQQQQQQQSQQPTTTGLFNRPASTFGFGGTSTTPSATPSAFGSFQQPQQQPTSNIFGQPQTSSFFGPTQPQQQQQQQPQPTGFGAPQSGGMFGSTPGAFGSAGFGQPAQQQQQQQPTSAFGAFGSSTSNQPTGSLFGQPSTAAPQQQSGFGGTGSLFGGSGAQQTTTTSTGGMFGQTAAPSGGSLFGAPKPLFGSTAAGAPAAPAFGQSGNLFGQQQPQQQQQQQPQQQTSFFGSTPSALPSMSAGFPSTTTQPQQQQQTSLFGAFGGAPSTATTQQQQQQQPSMFGGAQQPQQPQQTTSSSLFGSKPLFPGTSAPTLGQPSSGSTSLFGSSSNLLGGTQQPQQSTTGQPAAPSTSFNLFGGGGTNFSLSTQPQQQQQQQQQQPLFQFQQPQLTMSSLFGQQPQQQQQQLFGGSQFGQTSTQLPSALTSMAPPLPPALANITLQPAKQSSVSETPAKPSASQQPTTSAWRIKLRETSQAINENADQQSAATTTQVPTKPAVLVPRRFKTLTIDSPKPITSHLLQPETPLQKSTSFENLHDIKSHKPDQQQYGDYFTAPSESVLQKYSAEQLKSVSGFVAGKRGVGQITFLKPVDLSNVNLDDLFHKYIIFSPSQVVVYPDTATKVPPGKGLNQPAEIRLERCWPVNRSTRLPITDPSNERHKQHIERLKTVPETQFVDFQNDTGTWVFKVDHFSGYGVPEEYRMVDELSPSLAIKSSLATKSVSDTCEVPKVAITQVTPKLHIIRPVKSRWQGQFRTSMDCHGRIVSIQGTTVSLISLEEPPKMSEQQVMTLIRNPRSHADLSLLLDLKCIDRRDWLGRALRRWSSKVMNRSPVHAALICGDFASAEREAARMNRPWLAALLASDAKLDGDDIDVTGFDEVTKLALSLLRGKVDGVAKELGGDWLVDYALRYLYSGSSSGCIPEVVYQSFPNDILIPNILSCLLLDKPAVYHPQAFASIIINHQYPDMLIPFLASREFGTSDGLVMRKAYEQLLSMGYSNAAALLLAPLQDTDMVISHFSRFPMTSSCSAPPEIEGITRAWAFHATRDHEAEFDAWMMAEQVDKACVVFLNHLADQYVLTGEHGRLKARLSSLTPSQHPDLSVYRLYVLLRMDKDQLAGKNLTLCLDSRSTSQTLPLIKRIAFAEMAAACSEQGFMSKCLPPELRLMHCHRILSE